MNEAVYQMFKKYKDKCESPQDYKNALKEIIQEISLLGLWRGKFFEKASFYGGTALRILYGLNRFSEDMDFSLLTSNPNFDWENYQGYIENELKAYDLSATISKKKKTKESAVKSAFIKANTTENLLTIDMPLKERKKFHLNELLKIRIEIDTDPPKGANMEEHYLFAPIPFPVRVYSKEDLFAGKMHAILCRAWRSRVKGRDWFDMIWFIANKTPLHLSHVEKRMRQSGHYSEKDSLTLGRLREMLNARIDSLNIEQAKADIANFIKDQSQLEVWSQQLFKSIVQQIEVI